MSRSTSSVFRSVSLLVCITFSAVLAHAQYRASLRGTVSDSQGAVIPGATVTLVDTDTNKTIVSTSDRTFSAVLAHAQYRASLRGTVSDSQGAVIPGATVTLVDTDTNKTIVST